MTKRGIILKLFSFVLITLIILILLLSLSLAGTLKVTEEHPFLVNGNWINASELSVGDELTTIDGEKIIIENITDMISEDNLSVYNLEAGVYHN